MKLGTLFKDALHALFSRAATEPYPNPQPNETERLRGRLMWAPEGCTGCNLCVKDCPANAIDLFVLDKKAKQFVMRYDVGRCTFCGQCMQSCRFECWHAANNDWSLAGTTIDGFTYYYGEEDDVERVLAEPVEEHPVKV